MAFWPRKNDDAQADAHAAAQAAAAPQPAPVPPAPTVQPTNATGSQPSAGAGSATPELSPDQLRKAAEASKRLSAAFGEIVSIFMRTPAYAKVPLGELEHIVVPAVATGQFTLAEGQSKANGMVQPVGVILWARVTDELDRRMSADPAQPLRLAANEWASGERVWVMEAVGDPRVIDAMLKKMAETAWAGRSVKFRTRNKDGQPIIATMPTTRPQG